MNLHRRKFLGTACAVVLLAGVPWVGAAPAKPGDVFPDLESAGLEGKIPDLAGKVVIVDFWASWCVTCKKIMPVLAELQKKYGEKGVVVIGISLDEEKSHMEDYLKKYPMPFATVRDPKGKLAQKLDMQGLPTSFVLRPDRQIYAVNRTYEGDKTKARYSSQVEELLKAK